MCTINSTGLSVAALVFAQSILFSQTISAEIMVTPFKINTNQSILDDLKKRLKNTRCTDEPEDAG
jgi:hypothetical protein